MRYIIAILSLLSLGFSCYNITDSNGDFTLPQNETCFWIEAMNATFLHNNTIIVENITENITIVENITNTTENCTTEWINYSLGPGESISDPLRMCAASCAAAPSSNCTNTTVYTNQTVIQNVSTPYEYNFTFSLADGECYNNTEAKIYGCAEEENSTCTNTTVDTCEIPWDIKQFDLNPGEVQTVSECKSVFNCQQVDSAQGQVDITQPDWISSCAAPIFGWHCMDWLYANCNEDEQQIEAMGACHDRIEAGNNATISQLQTDNDWLRGQGDEKDAALMQKDEDLARAKEDNENLKNEGFVSSVPLMWAAITIFACFVIGEYWSRGRMVSHPNPNGKAPKPHEGKDWLGGRKGGSA